MTKSVKALERISDSAMANARDNPSKLLVALPSSSMRMREVGVKLFSMLATPFISAIEVPRLRSGSSLLSKRDISLLRTLIIALLAGTKQPICAKMTMSPIYFLNRKKKVSKIGRKGRNSRKY